MGANEGDNPISGKLLQLDLAAQSVQDNGSSTSWINVATLDLAYSDNLSHYHLMHYQIKFELSTKPSKQEKAAQGKSGFVPAIARWVIERSNAWMERCKILVKNHERTLANATTKLNLCFVRLMLKRLAAS